MKKTLFTFWLLAVAMMASAVPAKREWRTFTQSDGTQLRLMLVGDEHLHYYVTTDGKSVVEEGGNYVYARFTPNGVMGSDILAHESALRTAEEISAMEKLETTQEHKRMARAAGQQQFPHRVGTRSGDLTGSKKCLIILVSFNDLDFTTEDPRQEYYDMVNVDGYKKNGAVGSMHEYFTANSLGQFDLTFDVVGPYKAPNSVQYYGKNTGNRNDVNVRELVKFAMESADPDVDYTTYDWDGDGEVDQVYISYAGYSEAQGGPSYTIWPHESELGKSLFVDNRYRSSDGVYVNTYSIGSELKGASGSVMDGIGTMCHEFSHCMGLPDFYDTTANEGNANEQYGMDRWDVMSGGSYNGNGSVPAGYTAYERYFCGWLDYRDLVNPCKITGLKSVAQGGEAYRVVNPGNSDEYYVLETRSSQDKWDAQIALGFSFSGVMITHVTYDLNRFRANTVNRSGSGYQCMTIFHADNSDKTSISSAAEYRNDLYPYSSKNRELSDTSTPAATLNTPNSDGTYLMHCTISDFLKNGSVVDFVFNGGTQSWEDAHNPSGIQTVNAEFELEGQPATVYSVDGRLVMNTHSYDPETLKPGLYVVRTAAGTKKIVKK